ncbi:hypothetical protein [Paracoccus methylarcula]|uniref:hypothetical protein n=1 Tax=Paracoccus methylarcula TaxID=72022 RepID=UPI0011CE2712|nr:hypothetical protein [Paracoccus methylarcula]
MDRSTDFLILYDLAPIKLRPQLLDTYFEDPACRQSFEHIVHDRVLRAQFEFEYNGAVPFEDFRLLEAQGYLRHEGEFRSHVQSDHGREFPSVVTTDKGRNIAITLPDGLDPHVFFPIYAGISAGASWPSAKYLKSHLI